MKKYATAIILVVLALAGCVTQTEVGQRITIASSAPHSSVPQIQLSRNPYTDVPEKIALSALSEFDLKILAALLELKAKDSPNRDWWFAGRDGSFTYGASFTAKDSAIGLVSFRVNWISRTIDVGQTEKTEVIVQVLMNQLRAKLPNARISTGDYRTTHYYKFDVSP